MHKKEFHKFYDRYFDKIYRFVFFRVGGKRELAEDLTSEIFMKALEHFQSYDEKKSKSAWIYAIARNHLANHFRDSEKRPQVSLEELDGSAHIEMESQTEYGARFMVDGFDAVLKKDAENQMWWLLSELPRDKREFVTLKYILGYNYREIGEMAGVSEGAAKVATHRVLRELKQKNKK